MPPHARAASLLSDPMSASRPSGRANAYCEGGGGSSAGGVVVSGGGVVGDVVSEGGIVWSGGIVLVSGEAGAVAGGGAGVAVSSVVVSLGLHAASISAPSASTASDWNRIILWLLQVLTTN